MLSALMIVFGGFVTFQMIWNAYHPMPGMIYRRSGWPLAIIVGGMIIPFIARGRKTLIVKLRKGSFKWQAQFAIDKQTRELSANIQNEIVPACQRAGVHVVDSQ